jgi:hypothetical protein
VGKLLVEIATSADELMVMSGTVPVGRSALIVAASGLGELAVIRRLHRGDIGIATVAGILACDFDPDLFELRLRGLRFFAEALRGPRAISTADDSSIQVRPLPEAEFAAILSRQTPARGPSGFAEAETRFEASPLDRVSLQSIVLAAYSNICAFTGVPLMSTTADDAHAPIVAIRPLASGGSPAPHNFIAATYSARLAFEAGHLTVGPDFEFIAALDKIDPELLDILNPIGRLRLPALSAAPDEDALAFHRSNIFNRPL